MNKLLYIFVLIMTFSFALQMNAEEIKMPGLGISNKCDTLFPINSRINYNQPQYQLWYDRCMIAYNAYSGTLNQIIIDWKVAYQTNKVEDFEKVANGFQSLYETIVVNGESLTN